MRRRKVSYRTFVQTTIKSGERADSLNHAVIGLCGEAGEFANEYKKQFIYSPGQPMTEADRAKLLSELGDVRWYLEMSLIKLQCTMSDLEMLNMAKITARKAGK